jgi:hypothetical protein
VRRSRSVSIRARSVGTLGRGARRDSKVMAYVLATLGTPSLEHHRRRWQRRSQAVTDMVKRGRRKPSPWHSRTSPALRQNPRNQRRASPKDSPLSHRREHSTISWRLRCHAPAHSRGAVRRPSFRRCVLVSTSIAADCCKRARLRGLEFVDRFSTLICERRARRSDSTIYRYISRSLRSMTTTPLPSAQRLAP